MATTKVSELSAKTSLAGSEELLINDGGTSKKVTATNLLAGAVVGTGDITTAKLAADAVTNAKIADDSIDSEHYVDGSIDTAHIADNAITSAKLGVDVIVAEDIANNAITVAELADNAVTTAKILDANVTLAKIASEAVDEDNLYVSNAGTNGQYLQKQSGNNGGMTWADVDALPSQSGNNGKYLTTNGSAASWAVLDTDANTTTKGLYEHAHTISANYTISSGNNAMSAGPMTVDSGVSVTIPSGSTWVVVE